MNMIQHSTPSTTDWIIFYYIIYSDKDTCILKIVILQNACTIATEPKFNRTLDI